jgi:hypothetical protein
MSRDGIDELIEQKYNNINKYCIIGSGHQIVFDNPK